MKAACGCTRRKVTGVPAHKGLGIYEHVSLHRRAEPARHLEEPVKRSRGGKEPMPLHQRGSAPANPWVCEEFLIISERSTWDILCI